MPRKDERTIRKEEDVDVPSDIEKGGKGYCSNKGGSPPEEMGKGGGFKEGRDCIRLI